MLRRRELLWLGTGAALCVQANAAQARVVGAFLEGPLRHYDHAALGGTTHPSVLRVEFSDGASVHSLTYTLPAPFVFEDRVVRIADLDGDGIEELTVVRSGPDEGARLAVYRIAAQGGRYSLVQAALGPPAGSHRWMNPVGAAAFVRDGSLQIACVVTPHIGGMLRLYRYSPPELVAMASMPDVCNHVFGRSEQGLSAIAVLNAPVGPVVVVPDQSRTRLRQLAFDRARGWYESAAALALSAPVEKVQADGSGVRVRLEDGSERRVLMG